MDKLEKLIAQIMKECSDDGEPVTYEEAKEMAEMELKAKSQRNYTTTEKVMKKKSKPRITKVSNEKKMVFDNILQNLDKCEGVSRENIQILKENKLISVKINDTTIKIDVIEQRKTQE